MNALLRKELRLLQPSFLIGVIAALSIWTLPLGYKREGFWPLLRIAVPFVVCPAMLVMLALDSFGGEVSARTFSQLLSQSISRRRLWWTKTLLLAGATLAIWAIWYVSLRGLSKIEGVKFFPWNTYGIATPSLLFLFAVFSGGLWTVLLFRQVGVAFWATILVPLALCVGTYSLLSDADPHRADVIVVILFVLYGIVGFFFAQRLFLRAQDVQWSGGVITIPKWRSQPKLREAVVRKYRPRWMVLNREIQLQQSQFIIAAFLAVLHLAAVAARNFVDLRGHDVLHAVVHVFWLLWLLTPVLIGCAAIAEERRLGTLEGQLCIPASRRFQFLTKLGIVIVLSVLFGVLMPTLLESLDGTRIMANANNLTNGLLPNFDETVLWYWIFWYWIFLTPIAVISGLVAFYFSSLSRNTLQALGPSVLGILVVGFVLGASVFPEQVIGYPLWRGFIGDLIGVPVVGGVGLWLAYRNYRDLQRGLTLWNRNLGALLAALVLSVGSASGLYHRVWERLLPLEQKHGPARLDAFSHPELERQQGSLGVTLPDGQVWQGNFGYSLSSIFQMLAANWKLSEMSGGSRFLAGTNWASVGDCLFDTVGVQKDGTLWVSSKRLPIEFNRAFFGHSTTGLISQKEHSSDAAPAFERYGNSSDWKSVVANGRFAWLLKQDGTLWTWSTNGTSWTNWPGLGAFPLRQLGADSDWAEIRKVSSQYFYVRKKDGRVWSNLSNVAGDDSIRSVDQTLARSPFLDGHDWLGLAMVEYPANGPGWRRAAAAMGFFNRHVVGIRDDGRFRMVGSLDGTPHGFTQRDVQLDPGTNWMALEAFDVGEAVLLKADGSLWRWNLSPEENSDYRGLTRVGIQSDWRAIASDQTDLMALSADGSIWAWHKDPAGENVGNDLSLPFLIQVSRRAQFVANIFATQP